ncbi:uncharacterized protein LOC118414406 [Branchiostoma floridae]|uniref:Uncharacterized protein LOC118414406 n=1 Tax=Branchiostoma floridae TaxID=7739 RepID=A0A9J7MP13_BRAFL|nr:uncharacterized protein LOC118414406 [Branchiostoma floridae]
MRSIGVGGAWTLQIAAAVAGTAALVKCVTYLLRRRVERIWNEKLKVEDKIRLEDLGILARSPSANLRRAAEQVLLDKITQANHFTYVLRRCQHKDIKESFKACTVLCVVLKSMDIAPKYHVQILQTLAYCFLKSSSGHRGGVAMDTDGSSVHTRIQRMTAGAMFELIADSDEYKKFLTQECPGLLNSMVYTLGYSQSRDVVRYCLFFLHQLALNTSLQIMLTNEGAVSTVSEVVVKYHGDSGLQTICFQMLVIFANIQGKDSIQVLKEIARHNVVLYAVGSVRAEDPELVYWAVAVIHEFAINDLYKETICSIPRLLYSLQKVLAASEANLQRLVLRVICFLCLHNDDFKKKVLSNGNISERLSVCLSSGDKDVVHWALVLTHDLAMIGKSAVAQLVESSPGLLSSLKPLVKHKDVTIVRLLAETMGFFCSCEHLHLEVVEAGILDTILLFSQTSDPDLTFWAAALLLNLAMTSDVVKVAILKSGGLSSLLELAIGEHENTQIITMAAKTLTMLSFIGDPLNVQLACNSETTTISIYNKPHHVYRKGLNVLVYDTLQSEEIIYQTFSLEELEDVSLEGDIEIPCLSSIHHNWEGHLAFIIIWGKHNQLYLSGLKPHIESSNFDELSTEDLLPGQHCVLVAEIQQEGRLHFIAVEKKMPPFSFNIEISYAHLVNRRVKKMALDPTLKLLLSTPPTSNISKVSELELLEILARHEEFQDVIICREGFLDYLAVTVWDFTEKSLEELQSKPLAVAHCLGALKVLAALSVHECSRKTLVLHEVISAIVSLIFNITGLWIQETVNLGLMPSSLSRDTSEQSSGPENSPPLFLRCPKPPLASNQSDYQKTNSGLIQSPFSDVFVPESMQPPRSGPIVRVRSTEHSLQPINLEGRFNNQSQGETPYHTTNGEAAQEPSADECMVTRVGHGGIQSPRTGPHPVLMKQLTPRSAKTLSSVDQCFIERMSGGDDTEEGLTHGSVTIGEDFHKIFQSLIQYSILVLSNCCGTRDVDTWQLANMALTQSGALHMAWCALSSCHRKLRYSLRLPVASLVTRLASGPLGKSSSTAAVVLNPSDCTSALMLSSNLLEARNDSWTFESIRATQPVNRPWESAQPSGWYYEIELKSCGIIQIGWATRDCEFGPEKGIGVGDNVQSCAFDGARCKVWRGPITEQKDNEYGTEWHSADIVSCLLYSNGNVCFWLNGVNMGIAYRGLDMAQEWYPAASLSTEQQILFNFGIQPFRFCPPDGFLPVSEVVLHKSSASHIIPAPTVKGAQKRHKRKLYSRRKPFSPRISKENGGLAFDYRPQAVQWWVPLNGIAEEIDGSEEESIEDSTEDSIFDHQTLDLEGGGDPETPRVQNLWLYYEITVSGRQERTEDLEFGFSTMDRKAKVFAVLSPHGSLFLPSGHKIQLQEDDFSVLLTLGCGLTDNSTVVFMLNSRALEPEHPFEEEMEHDPKLPYTSCPHLDMNVGQRRFLYQPGSLQVHRLNQAALLHDWHQQRMEGFQVHGETPPQTDL